MRNSSVDVTVVVLTDGPPFVVVVVEVDVGLVVDEGFAFAWAAVEEVVTVVGVATPLEGFEPVACWRSLPCSAMRAGPSLWREERSWGTSFERTSSLTGCFELESE